MIARVRRSFDFLLVSLFLALIGCSGGGGAGDGPDGGDDVRIDAREPDDEVCDNGADDDGDGDVDCDDADCAGQPACPADCAAPVALSEPFTYGGNLDGRRDVTSASCQADGSVDIVLAFTPTNGDVAEFVLTSNAALVLFAQGTCGDASTELACASGTPQTGTSERVVLTGLSPGETIYLVVGGLGADDRGEFTITGASRTITCGDGLIDGSEECDDGNIEPDDGCDAECRAEQVSELEPNDDGAPEDGGGVDGNDFDAENANGPFTQDTVIAAAISPVGDEDVFEFKNEGAQAASLRLDTFATDLGIGVSCGDVIDTQLHVRSADGAGLDSNDDRSGSDSCSGLDVLVPAGASVYAHILDRSDNTEIAAYLLRASFAACGDGLREGLEQCDDGNNAPADGCSPECRIEPSCGNDIIDPDEECDDGNTTPGDGCSAECQIETDCGNGIMDQGEECDDGNTEPGDGCDAECQIETTCGDGNIEQGEECDDGNTQPGDGCDDECQLESTAETEPNDDGTPGNTGFGINGDDFAAANANGPFSTDTIIEAALSPAGDEDVFAITNTGSFASSVRFDTYNAALGLGVPCGPTIDTGLHIRNAAGTALATNDSRAGSSDRCSGLDFVVAAGNTVYVHVTDFGDNSVIAGYFLRIQFATCGDSVREGLEQCDDGNNQPGDGCSADCVSE